MALDLYDRVQMVGSEVAWRMTDERLTPCEADDLLERITQIAAVIAEWRAQRQDKS